MLSTFEDFCWLSCLRLTLTTFFDNLDTVKVTESIILLSEMCGKIINYLSKSLFSFTIRLEKLAKLLRGLSKAFPIKRSLMICFHRVLYSRCQFNLKHCFNMCNQKKQKQIKVFLVSFGRGFLILRRKLTRLNLKVITTFIHGRLLR